MLAIFGTCLPQLRSDCNVNIINGSVHVTLFEQPAVYVLLTVTSRTGVCQKLVLEVSPAQGAASGGIA